MQFARPPGGFRITIAKSVERYIATEAAENHPRLPQLWEALLKRLKIVALRESTLLKGEPRNRFVYIADGAISYGVPTIKLLFSCLGETLHIYAALVFNDQDHEDDEEDGGEV